MRDWKIHVSWAAFALLIAVASYRFGIGTAPGTPSSDARVRPGRSNFAPGSGPIPSRAPSTERPAIGNVVAPERTSLGLSVVQIRTFLNSPDQHEQYRAVEAIRLMADAELKRRLLMEELKSSTVGLRLNALEGLKGLSNAEDLYLFHETLLQDPVDRVRRQAAYMLGELPGPGTMESLLKAYHDDEVMVRIAAASSLASLGQAGPMSELIPTLGEGLMSPDGGIRRDAIEKLTDLRNPMTLPFLARGLRDSNGDVRGAAVHGLVWLGTTDVIPLLETVTQDSFPEVAEEAKRGVEILRRQQKK